MKNIVKGRKVAVIEPKTVILRNGRPACIRTRTLDDAEKVLTCIDLLKRLRLDRKARGKYYKPFVIQ